MIALHLDPELRAQLAAELAAGKDISHVGSGKLVIPEELHEGDPMKITHAKVRRDGEWQELVLLEGLTPWQLAVIDGWANGARLETGWRIPEGQRYDPFEGNGPELAAGGIVPPGDGPRLWEEEGPPEYLLPLRHEPKLDES